MNLLLDEHRGDDGQPLEGDDREAKRKREDPSARLLRSTTGSAGRFPTLGSSGDLQNEHDVLELETNYSPTSPSVVVEPMAEPLTAEKTAEERPSSEPLGPREYMELSSAAHCRSLSCEDMEHEHDRDVEESMEHGHETAETIAGHESSAVTLSTTRSMHAESQHVEVHDDCQSAVPIGGSIMMVLKD